MAADREFVPVIGGPEEGLVSWLEVEPRALRQIARAARRRKRRNTREAIRAFVGAAITAGVLLVIVMGIRVYL